MLCCTLLRTFFLLQLWMEKLKQCSHQFLCDCQTWKNSFIFLSGSPFGGGGSGNGSLFATIALTAWVQTLFILFIISCVMQRETDFGGTSNLQQHHHNIHNVHFFHVHMQNIFIQWVGTVVKVRALWGSTWGLIFRKKRGPSMSLSLTRPLAPHPLHHTWEHLTYYWPDFP